MCIEHAGHDPRQRATVRKNGKNIALEVDQSPEPGCDMLHDQGKRCCAFAELWLQVSQVEAEITHQEFNRPGAQGILSFHGVPA